jgi:hypothetical protein
MAPGREILSAAPNGKFAIMSDASVAVPIVTGSLALLCSEFSEATAMDIRYSLMKESSKNRTIIPLLFNIQKVRKILVDSIYGDKLT